MKITVNLIKKILIGITFSLAITNSSNAAEKVALVIGNASYQNLSPLANTKNDANSIEKSLREIGFTTTLVMDASETVFRKELRKFAEKSESASIAVVFYAGHGAQVGGENFLLPTDMELPKRDSDIQLSALKVDDLVNSLKAKTKVIFLDACRDNPALIKSFSKGRGAFRGGLAVAKNLSDDSTGGLFIAYATDAGNVALDGEGLNSPFTTALLKYIRQPISIDDMFSSVTRDVRIQTKNQQRPYKYASLDGVICLTNKCGTDITQAQSLPNQTLQSNSIESGWKNLDEWVLFNYRTDSEKSIDTLVYIQPSSVKSKNNRSWGLTKWVESSKSGKLSFLSKETTQKVTGYVIDCNTNMSNVYLMIDYHLDGKIKSDSKYGFPEVMALTYDYSDVNSIGYAMGKLMCNPEKMMPLVEKTLINSPNWERVATVIPGKDFYFLKGSEKKNGTVVNVITKLLHESPVDINKSIVGMGFPEINSEKVTVELFETYFDCKNKTFALGRNAAFNAGNTMLVNSNYLTTEADRKFDSINPGNYLETTLLYLCEVVK